jgi:hypothetical protein
MKNILFELLPFDVVNVEIFLPDSQSQNKAFRLDVEHSGNKVVIGYSILFQSSENKETSTMTQTLDLI